MPVLFVTLALVLTFNVTLIFAEQKPFNLKPITENLGIVWGMSVIDDSSLIFTQRSGEAGLLNIETGKVTWLSGLPEVHAERQGGLLDVKVSPDYADTGWIYFTYAKPTFLSAVTTLARARLQNNQLLDWQDLLVTKSESVQDIHFGSRIAFDNNGHVFFTVGDRGQRSNAQDLTNHSGTVLRLKLDGSVPKDNPFVGQPNMLNEIWSYGHRNPQGLVFDHQTQRLWEMEHGPKGGDEINLVLKGKNYGWPMVSQGNEYFSGSPVGVRHQEGMVEPTKVYIPSIAPSGLLIYRGKEFPEWQGSLFSGALVLRHLNQVYLTAEAKAIKEQRYLTNLRQRVRSLTVDSNGKMYVAVDDGIIYQISAD